MKKIFLVAVILFCISKVSDAVIVKLPCADVLKKDLECAGFENLVSATKIVKKLAGKELDVTTEIFVIVKEALYEYSKHIKNKEASNIMYALQSRIIRTILHEYPAAIEDIETKEFLE